MPSSECNGHQAGVGVDAIISQLLDQKGGILKFWRRLVLRNDTNNRNRTRYPHCQMLQGEILLGHAFLYFLSRAAQWREHDWNIWILLGISFTSVWWESHKWLLCYVFKITASIIILYWTLAFISYCRNMCYWSICFCCAVVIISRVKLCLLNWVMPWSESPNTGGGFRYVHWCWAGGCKGRAGCNWSCFETSCGWLWSSVPYCQSPAAGYPLLQCRSEV